MLTTDALTEIRAALASGAHGSKDSIVRALAARFGVSVGTVYRHARINGSKRPARTARRPEYREWVRIVVALSNRAPVPVPFDLALESSISGGLLPEEASTMPLSTAYRIIKELGLKATPSRTQRMHADYPMQAVQFDASSSAHISVDQQTGENEYLLKLHRSPIPISGYKNKPLAPHRMRLITYGIWDMCTGYRRAVYCVALGESAPDAVQAFCTMLEDTKDPARPLHGLPEALWSDQGPLFKANISLDLLNRMEVPLVTGAAYRKERMGGIERGWRTQWARFERSLFLSDKDTFTLAEINSRLQQYERIENAKRTSRIQVGGRTCSRTEAVAALMRSRPIPVRTMPANAMETLHHQAKRRIDRNGIVRLDGREYECKDWHDCWVTVRRALDNTSSLTLQNGKGERSTAQHYQPGHYGDVRAFPKSQLDHLLEASVDMGPGGDPYSESGTGKQADNITPLRMIAPPAEALENPLDASRYPDIESALSGFQALYPWPLSSSDLGAVTQAIERADFSRHSVADLASNLLQQITT